MSSDSPTVDLTIEDQIATVWLNRPDQRNAVNSALINDLLSVVDQIAASSVQAVVLTGRGPSFCAGHDVKERPAAADPRDRVERLQNITRRLWTLPQPVIAAVHGYAIGAGAEFALGCDLILAAEDAVFAFPEVSLGLSVTGAASRLLPLLVGPIKAKELLMFGDRVDAATALRMGLVNTVVASDTVVDHAIGWARRLAELPVPSLTLAKRSINAGLDATVENTLELEVSHAINTVFYTQHNNRNQAPESS